jgi:large subunit ribosomal protein L32
MTPLPKRRHSTRRGGKRKAAIKLSLPTVAICEHCGATKKPHTVCAACGYYNGKSIVEKKAVKAKK